MTIKGLLVLKTTRDDMSSFNIKIYENENHKDEPTTVKISNDGYFEHESLSLELVKICYIEICEKEKLIKNCGAFPTSKLKELILADIPYNLEEPKLKLKNEVVKGEKLSIAPRELLKGKDISLIEIGPKPLFENNKKLKGKVISKTGKLTIRNNQVIIYGTNINNSEKPAVLGLSTTDAEGNFSLAYPVGKFKEAFAIVSIVPEQKQSIFLNDNKELPDFIWIVLDKIPEEMTQEEHDDCACKNNDTPILPDMEELIQNSSYSQDIGGSCTNFTTPNRALEEFNYHMVVRTSDPELFEVPLDKINARINFINQRIQSIDLQLNSFSPFIPKKIDFKEFANLKEEASPTIKIDAKKLDKKLAINHSLSSISPNIRLNHERIAPNEFVSIDYLKFNIYNPNELILRQERNILIAEKERLNRLIAANGRIPLNGLNPIDWDDSDGTLGVVQASTIAFGHILNFKQVWRAAGYSLGDLLYSLPLAPGQKKQIAVFDWDRNETASRNESIDYRDNLQNSLIHDRDISEIVKSNLSENMTAGSHSRNSGKSAGIGAGFGSGTSGGGTGSYGGFNFMAAATSMFGISGGVNKSSGESWSDASQSSMRNFTASSDQQIRDKTMQNASSLRSQRATVVTSVGQSESFKVTTEVIANHNHCHALTIQYFEVLRHFALHQELSDVQECLFIPMHIESFNRKKVLRWRDLLSTYLFAPSDKFRLYHNGFDALQRIEAELNGDIDAYSDFPMNRYCDEALSNISGDLKLRLHVVRPSHTLPTNTNLTSLDIRNAIFQAFQSGGLHWWSHASDLAQKLANLSAEKIEENFQKELNWANFADDYLNGLKAYAIIGSTLQKVDLNLDFTIVAKKSLSSGRDGDIRIGDFEIVLSLRPTSNTLSILAGLSRAEISSIVIENTFSLPYGSTCLLQTGVLRYTSEHYSGILFNSNYINNDISNGDSALMTTPMNKDEIRNPRKDDKKSANLLLQHLDSNKEYYHKILWLFLDEQRLFNLLDKYSIQIPKLKYTNGKKSTDKIYGLELDNNGKPILEYQTKSVASVVELKRIGMAGNSIIFPVARGLNINQDYLLIPVYDIVDDVMVNNIKVKVGVIKEESKVDLIDLYKPLPGSKLESKPYRISVPTKGLFAEAIQGACNSCEKIDDSRFWKWEEHPGDEPTSIQPISTDTRRSDSGNLTAKDFPSPMINIQNAPNTPDPQGIANALLLMGKSDIFKDITGLDQNQKNALQAMLSNQESAKFFATEASKLAQESGKNADKALTTVADWDIKKRGQQIDAMKNIKDMPVENGSKNKYYDDAMKSIYGSNDHVDKAIENAKEDSQTPEVNLPKNADNVEYKNNKQGVELKYSLPKDVTTEKNTDGSSITEQTTTLSQNNLNSDSENTINGDETDDLGFDLLFNDNI